MRTAASVLGVEAHHQIAALDALTLLDRQLPDYAHDAGRERDALFGVGVSGNAGWRAHAARGAV